MDISSEMGSDEWLKPFGFQLQETRTLFLKTIQTLKTTPEAIHAAQEPIHNLRETVLITNVEKINRLFFELKGFEEKLTEFRTQPKEWEAESLSQLVFTQEWSRPLNEVPFLLPALSIFKIYIVPFFAVLIPLIAWILPFIILRFFFKIPMPFDTYLTTLSSMWLGGKVWSTMNVGERARILFQTCWTAFGMIQGVIQPVQQAFHMKKINDQILERGQFFQAYSAKLKEFFITYTAVTGKTTACPHLDVWPTEEPRQLYAYVRDHPTDLSWITHTLAKHEIQWCLAVCPELCFTKLTRTRGPSCKLVNFFDPSIPVEKRVTSSFVSRGHTVLTGPNKGGKSSILRALLLNVWLSQTYGVAFASAATLTPFAWIESGLRLVDQPGAQSLFERELSFASKVLRRSNLSEQGLLLYDELFHSTNPPDGTKTAKRFLDSLWTSNSVLSVVSTHVFELVEASPKHIQRLCVPASLSDTGIRFSFTLVPGICKVSSVEQLYKKFGFPASPKDNSKDNPKDNS